MLFSRQRGQEHIRVSQTRAPGHQVEPESQQALDLDMDLSGFRDDSLPDLPVPKRGKKSLGDVSINDGLHYGGIVLTPPVSCFEIQFG